VDGFPDQVLDLLAPRPRRVAVLKDVPGGNGSWLTETAAGKLVVLRRYHARATPEDLAYEHAVLRHLDGAGWVVPSPVSEAVAHQGLWYCLTRYVPGAAVAAEDAGQAGRRGRDLARLHLALRGLGDRMGQRPGWRAQHAGVTVHAGIDWDACLRALAEVSPRLAAWAQAAAARAHGSLTALGARDLPVMVVHGDFAEWNVHYEHGRLAGVIDFGLTHLDSRPYELAIARTYRSPRVTDAYRAELAAGGWPLSELEEAAVGPVYRAFRVDMAAWRIEAGLAAGRYDLAAIERQLARTGTPPPSGPSPGYRGISGLRGRSGQSRGTKVSAQDGCSAVIDRQVPAKGTNRVKRITLAVVLVSRSAMARGGARWVRGTTDRSG
jgi:homoserine kinase type II